MVFDHPSSGIRKKVEIERMFSPVFYEIQRVGTNHLMWYYHSQCAATFLDLTACPLYTDTLRTIFPLLYTLGYAFYTTKCSVQLCGDFSKPRASKSKQLRPTSLGITRESCHMDTCEVPRNLMHEITFSHASVRVIAKS